MPTAAREFVSAIKCCHLWLAYNKVLFCNATIAFFPDGEYDFDFAIILHFTVYWFSLSLSDQMCWLKAVVFLLLGFLKLFVCPLYRVLKVLSVSM